MSRAKLITPDQLKALYPKVYEVFFTDTGYQRFKQVGLALKMRVKNKEEQNTHKKPLTQ